MENAELAMLYKDHSPWLRNWLRRRTGCSHQAADLAQDTFLKLLARQDSVVGGLRRPRAFLATIARHLLIDHWRRRDLEQAWLDTLAALPEEEVPPPQEHLSLLETLVALDRMLDRLKPTVRQAFLLARLEGLTCPEVACRMGISLSTVERHIACALRRCYEVKFQL